VAEIISIDKKRLLSDTEKAARMRMRKIHAVRKVLQCTHCKMKCEKCGVYLEEDATPDPLRVPYRFCQSCQEEYIDYIDRLKGLGDSSCYWHNESWMRSWQAWIDYRGALDQHHQSREFMRLLKDLEQGEP
jgi:hypothetical protein